MYLSAIAQETWECTVRLLIEFSIAFQFTISKIQPLAKYSAPQINKNIDHEGRIKAQMKNKIPQTLDQIRYFLEGTEVDNFQIKKTRSL